MSYRFVSQVGDVTVESDFFSKDSHHICRHCRVDEGLLVFLVVVVVVVVVVAAAV